jgi:hypothetical protein
MFHAGFCIKVVQKDENSFRQKTPSQAFLHMNISFHQTVTSHVLPAAAIAIYGDGWRRED